MSLEPGLKALLQIPEFQLSRPPPGVPAAELRAAALPLPPFPVDEVHEVRDLQIPVPGATIAARLYRPSDRPHLPLIVYFHGGGFVFCGLDTHDPSLPHVGRQVWLRSCVGRLPPRAGAPVSRPARGLLPRDAMAGRSRQRPADRRGSPRGRRRQRGRQPRNRRLPTRAGAPRRAAAPPGAHLPGDRCRVRQRLLA